MKLKASILNAAAGCGRRVIRIEFPQGMEKEIVRKLRDADIDLDIRGVNW